MLLIQKQQLGDKIDMVEVNILKLQQQAKQLSSVGLTVTEHAIERFRQRILDLPRQRIKQILSSKALYEKWKTVKGERYRVKEAAGCIAVIKDATVITVYSSIDPDYRLNVLSKYMDYFIDNLVEKHLNGLEIPVKPFKMFIKDHPIR